MKASKMLLRCQRQFWIYIFATICLSELAWADPVRERCKDKGCQVEVEDGTSNDLRCNTTCRQQQGNSSEESVKMQFCMLGCRTAVDIHGGDLQAKLGKLGAPVLTQRTNTTVSLRWTGRRLANVTYRLQLRYVDKDDDEWHEHRLESWEWIRNKIEVDKLEPFIAYQFRIVAVLSDTTLVASPPSVTIMTEPYGAPKDHPTVLSLTCSSTTIHIRWAPPFRKNDKIIGYVIRLREKNGSVPKVKAISGTNVTILTMLQPSTEYEIRIAAKNRYGLGPETTSYTSTLPKEESFGATPYLVMGSNHSIRQKNLDETQQFRSKAIYNDSYSNIVDVAIHYYKNFIFFSNKSGEVYRLSRTTANSVISIYRSSKHPGPISVDWLHDRIYIAEDREIISCNLVGSSCLVVLDNLPRRPTHVVADPFNGYLFWSHDEPGGIYKIDLASLGTSINDLSMYAILQHQQVVWTFTLDFANYRLYYPDNTGEILLSINLDGTDKTNVRPQGTVQKAQFRNITSLSVFNLKFYWTNGSSVWFEEYDARARRYHHNTLYIFDHPFTGFNVWHPTAQPIPVPLQRPRNVQAVFSSRSTTLQWSRPDWNQGRGAWQDWFYEIEAQDLVESTPKTIYNITMSHQQFHKRIPDLHPERPYKFRVRAYTSAGYGPWSDEFRGETLKDDGSHPHLLCSSSGKIYPVGLDGAADGDSLDLDTGIKQLIVINGWYLWLNREHKLYIKRGRLDEPEWVDRIGDALVIGYDWLGEKLYWWNSRNQISRCSLNGRDREVENVYQGFSPAHHLSIDSAEGYMYWATDNTVEVAHLNNADHREISRLPLYEKHILGLTLDLDQRFLYWLVKENHKTLVYRTSLLSRTQTVPGRVENLAELEHLPPPGIQGMYYYSNRLFWLSSDDSVVVMDTKATHNVAKLKLPWGNKVESLTLVKPISGLPSETENTTVGRSVLVIPEPVQASSVNVSGPWDAFNISWEPTPVKHGNVSYQLLLTFGPNKQISESTDVPYLLVTNVSGIRPFMPIQLSMESCTYWGCSQRSTRDLFTPMSAPSPPHRVRGFVSYRRPPVSSDYTVEIEVHWAPPKYSNGRLGNYTINYQKKDGTWAISRDRGPNTTFYRLENASKNHTYIFRVSSCNEKCCSKQSEEVKVDTRVENPVPRLIAATESSIDLVLPVAQTSAEIWNRSGAVALTFEAMESALYLLDKSHIVKLVEVKGHEIVGFNGRGKSIAIDWLGRNLYWLEEEPKGNCEIRSYNIDRGESTTNEVLSMNMQGSNLAVHPYESSIFWSVDHPDGSGHIMRSFMNGTQPKTILGREVPGRNDRYSRRRGRRAAPGCNCPDLKLTSVFAMDHSKKEISEIYVAENTTGSIWASDLAGCKCRLVVNATNRTDLGLPPDSIAVDHQRLYWSSRRQATLHSVLKERGDGHFSEAMDGVKQIMAIGRHLQPFPDPKCLKTDNYYEAPTIKNQTNTSLSLVLGVWKPDRDCEGISLPRTRFSIYYRNASTTEDTNSCLPPGSICKLKITYDPEVTLTGLEPNKLYYTEVVADNFYTRDERPPPHGAHGIFITAPGVPSAPREVEAHVRTPESILVEWKAPADPNGRPEDIMYEIVCWKKQSTKPEYTRKVTSLPEEYKIGSFKYVARDLQPSGSYDFEVVAYYKEDRKMGESHRRINRATTTYTAPKLVEVLHTTDSSVTVSWTSVPNYKIKHHQFIIKLKDDLHNSNKAGFKYWTDDKTGKTYNETFKGLEPNTKYALFINVSYETADAFMIWPQNSTVIASTLAGPPRQAMAPRVENRNGQIHVRWTAPNNGGDPIEEYRLSAARRSRPNELNWTIVYNGTETHWIAADLETDMTYVFSVTAHNSKGASERSPESKPILFQPSISALTGSTDRLTIIIAVSFGVIALSVMFLGAIMLGTRMLKKHKPVPVDFVNPSPRADVELAILRDLPRNTRQHTNALYAINIVPTEEDVAALPHFRRDCLVLTKFLGSGAFGEVFEGVAKDILGPNIGDTRVAVKTLRKGASGVEKEEFLKEALLMDNFTHTHILHLLGVCLQNDPQFIILELMEGGDLLSYLRNARPTVNRPACLTMADMVAICTDVAKGCKYLEDMHFVHRDLAARNCLVSSIDPARRVVKIGDFGLARDIYKNDYYRKEGEGLLPVRWMSPESLIDGVFTTYSDVWAFGVLMWEVLTLGQQPYPARTNIEVLNYVRGGGRLDRPDHCPEDLHNVMLKCWCFSPGGRPSFSYLLSELESIKLPGIEASNHYTTTGLHVCDPLHKADPEDQPVIYSSVNSDPCPKPIQYTELSRIMQANAGTRQHDSSYVGPPTPLNHQGQNRAPSSSIARPRPVARPDHSPYLQPVSHTGGPNKYLELVADDDLPPGGRSGGGGGATSATEGNNSSSSASSRAPAGVHYAQLSGGDLDTSDYTRRHLRLDSPDIHSRDPKCQGQVTKKDFAIDYAQLALSDEADNAVDTDSEGVGPEPAVHHSHSRGQRPSDSHRNHSNSSRAGWPHHRQQNTYYAQIASTDSDTDSEIFDRSRSQSHSRDLSHDSSSSSGTAAVAAAAATAAATPAKNAGNAAVGAVSCDDVSTKHHRGWSPAQDNRSQVSGDHLAPYTIDGYLAPRSLRVANKQGHSSSSINSNNTSSGQSSC